jgi:hypothetical protein
MRGPGIGHVLGACLLHLKGFGFVSLLRLAEGNADDAGGRQQGRGQTVTDRTTSSIVIVKNRYGCSTSWVLIEHRPAGPAPLAARLASRAFALFVRRCSAVRRRVQTGTVERA